MDNTTLKQTWAQHLSAEEIETLSALSRSKRQAQWADVSAVEHAQAPERLATLAGMHFIGKPAIDGNAIKELPLAVMHEYQCLPIEQPNAQDMTALPLVTVWPVDAEVDEWMAVITGKRPVWYLTAQDTFNDLFNRFLGVGADSLDPSEMDDLAPVERGETEGEDENAAIIRFVNEVISQAIGHRATDIHFEPQKESLQIRYRIDGELVPVNLPPNLVRFQGAVISRIKIMARLNISERRRPQDGRIGFRTNDEELDIRVSSLPTMYGESISLRLLNQKSQPISIRELGFSEDEEHQVSEVLKRPHGIVLVTGPTGAGKSTTLTAFLRKIHTPGRRIITVEDPIEYEVAGVNQTQVHPEIGLSFATVLRHVLRQDPDVIMVGEIRDRETADISIRASLTGHLVLSTLHTNDAPGALTRLLDIDIEPFLIASSVEMVIAQRLVRRLCPECCRPADLEVTHLTSCLVALGVSPSEIAEGHRVQAPVGCDSCRGFGFRGRVGMFEILRITEPIHNLILQRASAREIRSTGVSIGMRTLQQSGWEQVKRGVTSLPEIMRYAESSEGDGE